MGFDGGAQAASLAANASRSGGSDRWISILVHRLVDRDGGVTLGIVSGDDPW
jgi:hypothetical protein